MARQHPLLRFRQAQFVLSKVLSEFEACEARDLNYHLDVEFDRELRDLLEKYGYDVDQAVSLITRHEALRDSVQRSPDGTFAQIYSKSVGKTSAT